MNGKICYREGCLFYGKEQSINSFHKDSKRKDGVHPYCKSCRVKLSTERIKNNPDARKKAYEAANRFKKSPKGIEYTKEYYQSHKQEFRDRDKAYGKIPEVREKRAKKQRDYRDRNKLKEGARRSVNFAIKAGVIKRPDVCEWCGRPRGEETLQAHHWMGHDFQNWFNVKFVHKKCHTFVENISPESWG